MRLNVERCRGILPRGGTILFTSRTNPYKVEGGRGPGARQTLAAHQVDALIAIGGEDTLGVAQQLHDERGRLDRRCAEDDRQRPVGHRGHLRLPHRRADRHRGHRPAPHDGRVPRPGDRVRGHGPPRRLDRHLRRDRRRRGRGARARGAVRHRRDLPQPAWPAIQRAGSPRSWWSPRVPSPRRAPSPWRRGRWTSSATSGSAASPTRWPRRSRSAPASRPASPSSGHIQRGGTPTAFDRVLATRFGMAAIDAVHDGAFGQMVALRADQIVRVPLADAVAELKTVDPSSSTGSPRCSSADRSAPDGAAGRPAQPRPPAPAASSRARQRPEQPGGGARPGCRRSSSASTSAPASVATSVPAARSHGCRPHS